MVRRPAFVFMFVLVVMLTVPQLAGAVATLPVKSDVPQGEEVAIPEGATPQQVRDIMAGLDDTQVRRMLIAELEHAAVPPKDMDEQAGLVGTILNGKAFVQHVKERLQYLFSGAAAAPRLLPDAFRKSLTGEGVHPPGRLLLGMVAITVMWFAVRWFVYRRIDGVRERIEDVEARATLWVKLGRLLARAVFDVVAVAFTALLTLVPYLLIFNEPEKGRPVIFAWLAAMVVVEVVRTAARFILAPSVPAIRFLPLGDRAATILNKWTLRISWVVALGLLAGSLVRMARGTELVYLLIVATTGFVVAFMVSLLALWHKNEVADIIRRSGGQRSLRHQLAGVWHVGGVVYAFAGWAFWVVALLVFGNKALIAGVVTLLVVPGYLLADWAAQRLVAFAADMADVPGTASDDAVSDKENDGDSKHVVSRFQHFLSAGFRLLVFAGAVVVLLQAWGVKIHFGRALVGAGIDTLLTLILAYIFWVYITGVIDRKLHDQHGPDEQVESGEGGGGPGGDRFSTLLQLVKKFIFVAIAVVSVLVILSSLGVDIGPLIAGASVFGIAIGFGAQTLVKDIISGIFFLMDDAFRVGDYIIVGKAKGTVEEISVRSFKLRHHRGPLYTIPFGAIKEIQNMSRDWAIMKLAYLVPFDTDVQQVKKIIKKINKEIRAIPELDEMMLDDIKSQGVKAMEEFGMRMRVKFMTKPGGQFTLRKLVLAKMRKYFEEAGIEFAKPRVSVSLPGETALTPEEELKVAAAAGEAIKTPANST